MHRCTAGALIGTVRIDIAAASTGFSAVRSRMRAHRHRRGALASTYLPEMRPVDSILCARVRPARPSDIPNTLTHAGPRPTPCPPRGPPEALVCAGAF
jgi:hypothetical protein